jgi:predicted transcriptional regulator
LEKSIYYQDYPKSISNVADKIIESLIEDEFFEKEGALVDVTFKKFADAILPKWINGNIMDIFSDDEFSSILNESIVESRVISLKERGFLDYIEDNEGKVHYFLTNQGKEAMALK